MKLQRKTIFSLKHLNVILSNTFPWPSIEKKVMVKCLEQDLTFIFVLTFQTTAPTCNQMSIRTYTFEATKVCYLCMKTIKHDPYACDPIPKINLTNKIIAYKGWRTTGRVHWGIT